MYSHGRVERPLGRQPIIWEEMALAVPIQLADVERVLRPWLGTIFLSSNSLAQEIAARLGEYAPYRQTLESLHEEMGPFILTRLSRLTGGAMRVMLDNYQTVRLSLQDLESLTDDVMGVLFDKLTPFSMNFVKLNDYALHVQSLSAMRVLYQKYAEFFSEEEFRFLVEMIRRTYPPARYQSWLGGR